MIVETKISIDNNQVKFLKNHASYGFKSPDDLVSNALELLQQKLEKEQKLAESAALYAEVFEEDEELQEWVEDSITDWE